jgi:hypothetical protein
MTTVLRKKLAETVELRVFTREQTEAIAQMVEFHGDGDEVPDELVPAMLELMQEA